MARKDDKTWETEKAPFPSRLSEIMKEQKVSQEKLAAALGVKRQPVSLYKTGQSSPNAEQLCKLASFFEVSADWLLGISDVKSVDHDIRTIHEITGLSETALNCLIAREQKQLFLSAGVNYVSIESKAINDLMSIADGRLMLSKIRHLGSQRTEFRDFAESKIHDLEKFVTENNMSNSDAFPYVGDVRKELFAKEKTERYDRFGSIELFVELIDELYPAIDWDYYNAICDTLDGMGEDSNE